MFKRMVRHMVVGTALVAVAGVAAAGALAYGDRKGTGSIEYLETMPVLQGDMGEVVVTSSRKDLPEVVVSATRVREADGYLAEVTVTAKRAAPAVVEMVMAAGLPSGALVQ